MINYFMLSSSEQENSLGGFRSYEYFMGIRWFQESLITGCFRWSPTYHPETKKQCHVSLSKNSASFVGMDVVLKHSVLF